MFLHQAGEKHFHLVEVVYVQYEIHPDSESELVIQSGLVPGEKAEIELSSEMHGKKVDVVEDDIAGLFSGVEILIQHN